jgi:hypothetical protein
MTNSTRLEGWLRRSNFIEDDEDPIQATIPDPELRQAMGKLAGAQLKLYKKDNPKEYNKKLFPFAFSTSSFPQNPQSFVKQWANLQELPTSGRCARVNT